MPMFFNGLAKPIYGAFCLAAALSVAGCNGGVDPSLLIDGNRGSQNVQIEPAAVSQPSHYRLGTNDKIRLIVYGEPDLSGQFVVDSTGSVDLPLIGNVRAKGLTLREFQERAVAHYKNGYLNDPKVSAEVLNYRPFFITGEIKKGGQYPYRTGLTVQDSIAIAGGYTYRANTDKVFIRREGQDKEFAVTLRSRVPIVPGDNIRIPERYF